MKREDFKSIERKHVNICRKIIKNDGSCYDILCSQCPFCSDNSTTYKSCLRYHETCFGYLSNVKDDIMKDNAQKFINLANDVILTELSNKVDILENKLDELTNNTEKDLREFIKKIENIYITREQFFEIYKEVYDIVSKGE